MAPDRPNTPATPGSGDRDHLGPLPESLARRPIDRRRKLPAPYVNVIRPDGSVDFSIIDARKAFEVGEQALCGLCREPLEVPMAFLGGPASAQAQAYVDPPMHVPCAEAALRLCPHINRRSMPRRPETAGAVMPDGFALAKPAEWVLYLTNGYQLAVQGDVLVFRPLRPLGVRRYRYGPDGHLDTIHPH